MGQCLSRLPGYSALLRLVRALVGDRGNNISETTVNANWDVSGHKDNTTDNYFPQSSQVVSSVLPASTVINPMSLVCNACQIAPFSPSAFHVAWKASNDSECDGFSYTCEWKAVHDSAAEGCAWCLILAEALPTALEYKTRNAEDVAKETFHVSVAFKRRHESGTLYLRLEVENFVQPYEIHSDPGDIAANYITEREIVHQVGTAQCFEDAAKALHACCELQLGHEECRPPIESILPTRLIDCLDSTKPRLHIAQPDSQDFYAALSYVWGEDQPNKTTTENIAAYTDEINLVLLPQTICDAIICTKKLGLRYLWVDALCILQDSKEDKRREISRMRNIYRNAYVTIVAASATRVSEGFLQDRPAPVPAVCLPFVCPGPDGSMGTMLIREPRMQSMSQDVVNSRAWCLEERLLTQRALIYSFHGLQFSCISTKPHALGRSSNAFYAESIRLPSFMFYSEDESYQKLSLDELSLELPVEEVREIKLQGSWNSIVVEYTRRDLTHQKDRLVAVAGVAEEFQRFWKSSQYFAGLWSHSLLDDLLWQKSEEDGVQIRPEKYRAPSWSWAAVNGKVLPGPSSHVLGSSKCFYPCEVLHCETKLTDPNYHFGEVTEGVLELKAIMNEVLWSPPTSSLFLIGQGDRKDLLTRLAPPDCDEEITRREWKVWAIPIRRCLGGDLSSIEGILVVPVTDTEGIYRRVGSFTIGTRKALPYLDINFWLDQSRAVAVFIV